MEGVHVHGSTLESQEVGKLNTGKSEHPSDTEKSRKEQKRSNCMTGPGGRDPWPSRESPPHHVRTKEQHAAKNTHLLTTEPQMKKKQKQRG